MPVSRKRKKTRKSKTSARALPPKTRPDRGELSQRELPTGLAGLLTYGAALDQRRVSLAAAAAEALVVDLVELARARPDRELEDRELDDRELEDQVCVQLGARLRQWAQVPFDDRVTPEQFAEAAVAEAAMAVRAGLREPTAEPDGWPAPWRVLTALAGIVAYPLSRTAADAIKELRQLPGGRALPPTPEGLKITGQVLWTRDVYGSRFGVTAPFRTPDGSDRWYLWDIDACGYQPFLVHSAYYPTCEQALMAWQAGVGPLAAGQAAFAPVDDPSLLAYLMHMEEGVVLSGGESVREAGEYYRSRRLAAAAVDSFRSRHRGQWAGADAEGAATEFAVWLRARRAGQPRQADAQARQADAQASDPEQTDLDEQITELADSWDFQGPAVLYHTCSPHRVALTVLHLRNYYLDDFADELVALLPEWTEWLAQRNNTPPHLAERCRPYALGQPHADVGCDDSRPNYQARVIE